MIKAMGIGAPNGNYYNGTIEFAPNLSWGHDGIVPLAAMFKERLGILCEGLRNKYPAGKILFFTPWRCENFAGSMRAKVIDAIKEVCGDYQIPVFDAARQSNIESDNFDFRKKYFQGGKGTDTAHLNAKGHDLFLPVAEQFILQYVDLNSATL